MNESHIPAQGTIEEEDVSDTHARTTDRLGHSFKGRHSQTDRERAARAGPPVTSVKAVTEEGRDRTQKAAEGDRASEGRKEVQK